ncbi:MAG TPA: autotransporter-associated beta strand repeat-containing protein [Rhizomicrobium sp.]|jgi:autotransporter-associated beta strand protein
MATDKWLIGLSGDWNAGANWSTGAAPGAADDVVIDVGGAYTINLATAVTINSLDLEAGASAVLSQAANAPLTVAGQLSVDGSTAVLRAANVIGGPVFVEDSGTIGVANNAALGNAELFNTGGTLTAIANVTLDNPIATSNDAIFSAGTNKTLSLTGQFSIGASSTVEFGSLSPQPQGVVNFAPSGLTVGSGTEMYVNNGTLLMGNATAASQLTNIVLAVAAAGTLDLNGHAAEIESLQGNGLITESGGLVSLTLDSGIYTGKMTGLIAVGTEAGVEIDSALTYTGGTVIAPSSILQLGNANALGSLTGAIFVGGELRLSGPAGSSFTLANNLSGTGLLALAMQDTESTVAINHANTYASGTIILEGTLALGNAAGIGAGPITITAGGIEATQTETIDNDLSASDMTQLSAASGKTLTIDSNWTVADNTNIAFGANGHNGTVVVHFESLTVGSNTSVSVESGTLAVGDNVPFLFADAAKTTIGAGATLDVRGNEVPIADLEGAGTILNSGAAAPLAIGNGQFAGVITGALATEVSGNLILSGTDTYTGGTTIDSTAILALGNGGTTGSITGAIADQGILIFDRSDALTIDHAISGTGIVEQRGTGTVTLGANNTYSGNTIVTTGTLAYGHAGAFGTGEIVMQGGTLLGAISQTIGNDLALSGNDTLAAANGKTVSLTQDWNVGASTAIVFGATGKAGTLSVSVTGGSIGSHVTTSIADGVVAVGNAAAGLVIGGGDSTTVGAAGALDLNGHDIAVTNLLGSGIVRSTAAATLTLKDAVFSGHLNGDVAVVIGDNVTLSGGGNFTGGAAIDTNAKLDLKNSAAEDVTFAGTGARLTLDTPSSFSGTIGGMVHTDKIDLTTIASATAHLTFNATTDVMTVTDGTHTATLQFVNGYVQNDFGLSDDGHGHTFVTTSVTTPPHLPDMDALI